MQGVVHEERDWQTLLARLLPSSSFLKNVTQNWMQSGLFGTFGGWIIEGNFPFHRRPPPSGSRVHVAN
jgi:hypothetical protein